MVRRCILISIRLLCILLGLCSEGLILPNALAQVPYVDCDKQVAFECVAEFSANREKFGRYLAALNLVADQVGLEPGCEDSLGETQLIASEDRAKKLLRFDFCVNNSMDNPDGQSLGWVSDYFSPKGNVRYMHGNSTDIVPGLWAATDFWNLSIVTQRDVEVGRCRPNWWMEVFAKDKLLAAQENGRFVRGEWQIGERGLGRLHVYFDSKCGKMPVSCRYFLPVNLDSRFSTEAKRIAITEVKTSWKKMQKGWVPTSITNRYEGFNGRTGKLQYTNNWEIELHWGDDSKIQEQIYKPGEILGDELYELILESAKKAK